jgi:hypothetical protein
MPVFGTPCQANMKNTDTAWNKGYDASKKVSGIKQHIAVDTQGLPHTIGITMVEVTDRASALAMFGQHQAFLSKVTKVLVDGGYTGALFAGGIKKLLGATVEITKRNELHTFAVMPKRWGRGAPAIGSTSAILKLPHRWCWAKRRAAGRNAMPRPARSACRWPCKACSSTMWRCAMRPNCYMNCFPRDGSRSMACWSTSLPSAAARSMSIRWRGAASVMRHRAHRPVLLRHCRTPCEVRLSVSA